MATLFANLVVHSPQVNGVLVVLVMGIRRLVNRHLVRIFLFVVTALDFFLDFSCESLIIDSGSLRRCIISQQGLVVLEKSSCILIFCRQREKVVLFVLP